MGLDLFNKQVLDTYDAIIKVGDNNTLTGTPKLLSDGRGNDTPIYLGTSSMGINITPDSGIAFQVNGGSKFTNITVTGQVTDGLVINGETLTTTLQFTGGTGDQGTMSWNTEDETIDLIVSPDVTYQLGQELGQVVRNLSGSTLVNGSVVRVTGASGNKVTVDLASYEGENDSSSTFAIVTETINNNSTGRVTTNGLVRGLNTLSLTEGVAIWLGANGTFTQTKPQTPNHLVHLGWVVRSHATEGAILVHISNGWEMEELHDVLITSIADKDLVVWDAANGYWKNSKTLGNITTGTISSGNITTSGYLRGPATFVIDPSAYDDVTGLVQILGDLRVDGVTTTVNSTTVTINDKNIVLADEAVTAGDADGAGITINGANATLTYASATDDFHFNKNVNAGTFIGALTGNVTGNADTASKWATARTITIGDTGKSVDGSGDVSWSKSEIGFDFQDVTDNGATTTNDVTVSRLRVTAVNDASATSTLHGLQVGSTTSTNIIMDGNELMARNNGVVSGLNLNPDGGDVTIHNNTTAGTFTIGGETVWHSGNDNVFTLQYITDNGSTTTNALSINSDTFTEFRSATDNNDVGLRFSSMTAGTQYGDFKFNHVNTQSYGSLASFVLSSSESDLAILADGKLLYKTGIYVKPATGTGAGTLFVDSSRNITANDGTFGGNITSTGYIRAGSGTGSAASPQLQIGDDDSGLFDSGANEIGVALGGTLEYEFLPTALDLKTNALQIGGVDVITTSKDFVGRNGTFSGDLDVNGTGVTNFAGDVTVEGTFTMNGASLVYNDMTFSDAGIIMETNTTATRGIIWDVGTSGFLSKIDGGGANGGMLEIYTNLDDAITTGDVFRVKEGSTAATLFSVTGNGDATISGGLNLGGNLLMDFSGTTYSDAIVFRGAASSAGEIGIRANGEAFELYEPEDVNKVWLTIADDPAANNTAFQVNSTSGMVPVLHSINMSSYVTTAYIQSQGFLRDTTDTFTGTLTINGSQTINGSGNRLTFSGGNNRIYFGAYRALEATTTSGATLQLGESYATTRLYGNVGIDKAVPDSRLHIHKAADSPVLLTLENYVADINGAGGVHGNFIDFKTSDANATSQPQARIGMLVKDYTGDAGIPSEGDGNLVFYTNDGTDGLGNGTLSEVMRLTHQKNVGIGTDSPSYTLHAYHPTTNVVGQFQSGDNQAWISVRDNNYTTYGAMLGCDYSSGMNIILGGNGAEKLLTISNGGNVGIGLGNATADSNRMLHIKGSTTGSVKIEASGTSDTFIDFKTTNNEAFIGIDESANVLKINNTNTLGSAVHMAISTSGNVGIGTASPTKYISSTETVLHIQNSNVASINLDSTGGSGRNYVMMSTASGNWQIYDVDASSTRFTLGSSGSFGFGTTSLSGTNRIEIESTNAYDLSTGGNDTGGILIKGAVSTGDGSYTGGIGFGFGTGTAGITAKQYGSDSDRLGLSFFVHGSTTGNNPTAEKMTLDYTGSLTVGTGTEANQVRVYWDDTAEWTDYTGYGISFHRSASYLRPDVNNLKTMYFGYSSLAWAEIQQHANEHNWYNLSGSFAMRLNGSGNLGLGTSSPNGKFTTVGTYATVTHSLAANSAISISSMGVNGSGFNAFTIGQANSTNNCGVMRFGYAGAGSTSNYVGFGFYANDDILTIKPNGNVGIGTTENYTNLYIKGAAPYITIANTTEDDGGIFFTDYQAGANPLSSNSQSAAIKFNSSNNQLSFYNNDVNNAALIIGTDSISYFQGSIYTITGSVANLSIRLGDTNTDFYDSGANTIGVVCDGSLKYNFEANGTFRAAADIVAYYSFSDARLKTNVKPLENSLEKVKQLQGVSYEWIDGERKGKTEVGLIAQEVEKVVPEVVREQKRLGDDTEYKTVDYEKMVGVLIEAVKELSAEVESLKAKL